MMNMAYLIRESWKNRDFSKYGKPPTKGKVNVNGVNLSYKIMGNGKPLVMITGLAAGRWIWHFQKPLTKHFRLITFDNKGSGSSDKPLGKYMIEEMAAETVGLMDYLGIEKANALGVSLGGMVLQEIAIRYPSRVEKLVLASTATGMRDILYGDDGTAILDGFLKSAGINKRLSLEEMLELDIDALDIGSLLKYFTDVSFNHRKFRMIFLPVAGMYSRISKRGIAGQLAAVMSYSSLDRIGMIKAPTLVMCGTADRCVPPYCSDALALGIGGAKLVKVEDGSHSMFMEMSDRFNEEVVGFLK